MKDPMEMAKSIKIPEIVNFVGHAMYANSVITKNTFNQMLNI